MPDPDLKAVLELVQRSLTEQAAMRADMREDRQLMLALVDQGRRIERRLSELRDDLELMLKAELMGRLGHFETQMEARISALESRLQNP